MLTSPPEIFAKSDELKRRNEPFVLATVIAVRGAASAKTGSKAIFDLHGKNILGWVGGGCAESFLARQALEALHSKTPRIVNVDLDDEVFGLMPCGGVMDVYLEPHFPALKINISDSGAWNEPIVQFLAQLGFASSIGGQGGAKITHWASAFKKVALTLARSLGQPLRPWRELKGISGFANPKLHEKPVQLIVLGQTRITEELSRLSKLLDWPLTVYAQNPQGEAFPKGTSVCELPIDFSSVNVSEGAWVIVASHHQMDHKFIAHAFSSKAEYVALVASEKRTRLIFADLKKSGFTDLEMARFFAPAGLTLPAETPTQIAFSILCEILFLKRNETPWT